MSRMPPTKKPEPPPEGEGSRREEGAFQRRSYGHLMQLGSNRPTRTGSYFCGQSTGRCADGVRRHGKRARLQRMVGRGLFFFKQKTAYEITSGRTTLRTKTHRGPVGAPLTCSTRSKKTSPARKNTSPTPIVCAPVARRPADP